jgi:hypothetical protein
MPYYEVSRTNFQNRAVRRIFGPKAVDVKAACNEELHNLFYF